VAWLAGVAPVVERSGRSTWVHWRFCCPKFLRQSFVEYAFSHHLFDITIR
jgi:hypothetical protein